MPGSSLSPYAWAIRAEHPRHPQRAQVEAMIGVLVAQADRVDIADADVPLQHADGTAAEIDHEPETFGLEQVAGRGAVWAGIGPGTADDCQAHGDQATRRPPARQARPGRGRPGLSGGSARPGGPPSPTPRIPRRTSRR